MIISQFKRSAKNTVRAVRRGHCDSLTARSGLNLKVRLYTNQDADLVHIPWLDVTRKSAAGWEQFLTENGACCITVDNSPSLVVERWEDETL